MMILEQVQQLSVFVLSIDANVKDKHNCRSEPHHYYIYKG